MMIMKRLMIFFTVLLAVSSALAQLDSWYHSPDEIREYIYDLQEQYPDLVKVDTVGFSTREHLPIYMVKVSNQVHQDLDRPTVLFCGQIHAEEVQGVELVLRAMTELVTLPNREYRNRRNNLEVYFIPTLNPEGLNVVHGIGDDLVLGADVSFRKNKRDNVGDGVFRYHIVDQGGSDTTGVDINRNFPINWFQGDSLYTRRQHLELWDYYRGPYPGSESEYQTVRDVCYQIRPLFSQTFHTSRTGNFSEKVMFPWDWDALAGDDGKACPDIDVMLDIAADFAGHLDGANGGHYEAAASGGRNGKMHDWMYAEGGWVNMQTELSSIQPDSAYAVQIQEWTIDALYYLMDRAWEEGIGSSIKVIVKDPDGNPLEAEVYLPDYHNGYLKPRMTDPLYGVHRRPLLESIYTVICRKWGYEVDQQQVFVGDGFETPHRVTLQPLPTHLTAVGIYDAATENRIPATLVLHRDWGIDTLDASTGIIINNWPEGSYELEVFAEGYIPRKYEFAINGETHINAILTRPSYSFLDDFETSVPDNWTTGAGFAWDRSGREKHSGLVSLESVPYQRIPANGSGSVTARFDIPANAASLTITGWHAFELEPDYDSCLVDLSFDGGATYIPYDTLNGFSRWQPFFYEIQDFNNAANVLIRWTINTDATDTDRGLFLDDVGLLADSVFVNVNDKVELPGNWCLNAAYPNPFNPSTTISFEVASTSSVRLVLFDVMGREIMNLADGEMTTGSHSINVDFSDFASGLYFVRMDAPGYSKSQKLMLIK